MQDAQAQCFHIHLGPPALAPAAHGMFTSVVAISQFPSQPCIEKIYAKMIYAISIDTFKRPVLIFARNLADYLQVGVRSRLGKGNKTGSIFAICLQSLRPQSRLSARSCLQTGQTITDGNQSRRSKHRKATPFGGSQAGCQLQGRSGCFVIFWYSGRGSVRR